MSEDELAKKRKINEMISRAVSPEKKFETSAENLESFYNALWGKPYSSATTGTKEYIDNGRTVGEPSLTQYDFGTAPKNITELPQQETPSEIPNNVIYLFGKQD